jgi:DNA polymerase/3'-5' exonuclease PolX
MDLDYAIGVAEEIRNCLLSYCERVEIAGSVRRMKPTNIHDVEIVLIPKSAHLSELADVINKKWGSPSIGKWPAKYTKIRGAYQIDVFTATKENWGLLFFIRTGPAEYAQRALVDWKKICPGGYSEGAIFRAADGSKVLTPEEADVFRVLRRDYVPPEKRF